MDTVAIATGNMLHQQIESVVTPLIKTAAKVYMHTFGLIPPFLFDFQLGESNFRILLKYPTKCKPLIWTIWIASHILFTCLGTVLILVQKYLNPKEIQVGVLETGVYSLVFGSYCWLMSLLYHLIYNPNIVYLLNRLFANKLQYSKPYTIRFISLK